MDMDRIEAVIEAVLFAMGDSVPVDKLAVAIGHDEETTVEHEIKYNPFLRGI